MSFDTLTVIVLVNVAVTIALWLERARRPPQPKLKKKFIEQFSVTASPITPKHDPPKTFEPYFMRREEAQLFFTDFADFANVVNDWLADEYVRSRWRLQELPKTELTLHGNFDSGPEFGRSYAVFYNQVRLGELEVQPSRYRADNPNIIVHVHLDYVRLLPFHTIRELFEAIAMYACDDRADSNGEKYREAQQDIDRAMTEALWESNQIDVYNIGALDTGEINLRLNGPASHYLERREFLRNQATSTAQADETMEKLTKTETQKSTKRWSLARAAFYGLLLSGVVFAANVITGPPDPWLRAPPAELLAYLAGNFAPAPIIFVLIAATRNAFYGLRPWEPKAHQ